MKRLIPAIIILSAAVTSVTAAASQPTRSYIDDYPRLSDTTIVIAGPDAAITSQALEIRASLPKADLGSPLLSFGIIWDLDAEGGTYYKVTLRPISRFPEDTFANDNYQLLTIARHTPGGETVIEELKLRDGFGQMREANTLGVEIDLPSAKATVYGGKQELTKLAELTMEGAYSPTMAVEAQGDLEIYDLVSEYTRDRGLDLQSPWTAAELASHLKNAKNPAGFYRYLDRNNAPEYLRLGGKYTLALVETAEGGFDIVYVDGAERNRSKWTPGMLKGHLSPTIFTDHYDLTWYDADLNRLDDECSADIEQGAILTLNFPLLKSSFRFALCPDGLPDK